MAEQKIEAGKVASVHYRGTLTKGGEEFDSSIGHEPIDFLVGADQMIPGFEKSLLGAKVGEKRKFNVKAEDAYGEYDPEGTEEVERDQFPEDIEEGMTLEAEMPDGDSFPVRVVKISDETVTIDFNHELAGKDLTFEVEVIALRDATSEEMEHGHAH